MKASLKRNEQFDYIKAISVLMVVLHHCIDNYASITSDSSLLIRLLIVLLHTCHVPIFLIVAGYFCHEQPKAVFYKKKLTKIFIPFVVFSVLKLVYSVLISDEFAHGGETLVEQVRYSIFIGRQYWFIYTILGMYLIAPLFWTKKDEQSNGLIVLIISYAVVCLIAIFNIPLPEWFQIDHIINYLPYFVFGCVLRQEKGAILRVLDQKKIKTLVPVTILLIVSFLNTYIYYPAIRNYPVRFFIAVSMFLVIYELTKKIKKGKNRYLQTGGSHHIALLAYRFSIVCKARQSRRKTP